MPGKVVFFLGLLLAVAGPIRAQTEPPTPYLVFDAGGHTATVNKVRFTPDGRQLVSVSNDKTARIWDVQTGEPLIVLRPPIGDGPAGMLYAADISPDGRLLAVAGFESSVDEHAIYLIRLSTSKTEAVLRGHTNVVLDVAFSPDGRYLASVSADKTARLWEVSTQRCQRTFYGHREGVYAVAFSPDSQSLATASLDKTGRIWSIRADTSTGTLAGHVAAVQAVAWSPDGRTLGTGCADQSINLWSPDGRLQRRFEKLGNQVTSLSFSPDSWELFYTLGGAGASDGGFLIDLGTNRRRMSFTQHENSVTCGSLSPNGALAATADANGEVFVWRSRDGSRVYRLRSAGRTPWSAAWDWPHGAIAWGETSDYSEPNCRGPLEYVFQPRDLAFVRTTGADLRRARTNLGTLSLVSLDITRLAITRDGQEDARVELASPQDRVRCFTLLDEDTVAVGSDFGLFLFDTQNGRRIRELTGHSGAVWAVAPSPNGNYLLSASEDQTLRVWSWPAGRLVLSFFFADQQWIAWMPEGYYAASPGGERLMGWQVNNGRDQLGDFYPAAQFRNSLYRPDVICRLLDAGGVSQALQLVDTIRLGESEPTRVEQVLPPLVRITDPSGHVVELTRPTLRVRAAAQRRGRHPVTGLRLLLDGRPYDGQKGVYVVPRESPEAADEVGRTWTVELTPGCHRLAVQAETIASKGLSDVVEVVYRETAATQPPRLPDLYALAIGISNYPDRLKLDYAAKDAQILGQTLQQSSASLFRNVDVRLLTNDRATRRDLLSGLTWLRSEMTQRDVAMFFFSGHGAKDEAGNFFLVPVDGETEDLLATSVSGSQFKDALAAIPGRVLVLLDACHAGAAGGDSRKAADALTDDLVRDLVTDDYGVIVMCSSMGREYSMESDEHQQGYFTMALVEALTGKADYNQDGVVYSTEVDTYVSDRVKLLTDGLQHPVTTKPATIRSFPLSKPP